MLIATESRLVKCRLPDAERRISPAVHSVLRFSPADPSAVAASGQILCQKCASDPGFHAACAS